MTASPCDRSTYTSHLSQVWPSASPASSTIASTTYNVRRAILLAAPRRMTRVTSALPPWRRCVRNVTQWRTDDRWFGVSIGGRDVRTNRRSPSRAQACVVSDALHDKTCPFFLCPIVGENHGLDKSDDRYYTLFSGAKLGDTLSDVLRSS